MITQGPAKSEETDPFALFSKSLLTGFKSQCQINRHFYPMPQNPYASAAPPDAEKSARVLRKSSTQPKI